MPEDHTNFNFGNDIFRKDDFDNLHEYLSLIHI